MIQNIKYKIQKFNTFKYKRKGWKIMGKILSIKSGVL